MAPEQVARTDTFRQTREAHPSLFVVDETGLRIAAEWDHGDYPTGIKVTKAELAAVPLEPHEWHGEWNYDILPHVRT